MLMIMIMVIVGENPERAEGVSYFMRPLDPEALGKISSPLFPLGVPVWRYHSLLFPFIIFFSRELTSKEVAFYNRLNNIEPIVTEGLDTKVTNKTFF